MILHKYKTISNAARKLKVGRHIIYKLLETEYSKTYCTKIRRPRIRLDQVVKIMHDMNLNIKMIEENIERLCGITGFGVQNPKLPFKLNTPLFSAFISAIFGDGYFKVKNKPRNKGRVIYINQNDFLIRKIQNLAIKIFGGNENNYPVHGTKYSEKEVVYFPSVIRDTLYIIGTASGSKTELNPGVHPIVINSDDRLMWINWLQQTADDEGWPVNSKKYYTRSIVWKRSVDITHLIDPSNIESKVYPTGFSSETKELIMSCPPNLLLDEKILLDRLGIKAIVEPFEVYITKNKKVKVTWILRISRKNNIRKFAAVIGFSHPEKQKKLHELLQSYSK